MQNPPRRPRGLPTLATTLAILLASCDTSSGTRDSIGDPTAPTPYALHLIAAGPDTARGGGFILRYRWPFGLIEKSGLHVFVGPESNPGFLIRDNKVPYSISTNRRITFRIEALQSYAHGISRTLDIDTTTRLVYARKSTKDDAPELRAVDDFGRSSRPNAGIRLETEPRMFVGTNGRDLAFVGTSSEGTRLYRSKIGDSIVQPVDADFSSVETKLGWNAGATSLAHWRASSTERLGTLSLAFDAKSIEIGQNVVAPTHGMPFAFSPDGAQLAFIREQSDVCTLVLLDVISSSLGGQVHSDIDCDLITRVAWSRDGDSIAVLGHKEDTGISTLTRFDGNLEGGMERKIVSRSADKHRGPTDFAWSPTGDRLLVIGDYLLDKKMNVRVYENGQFTSWAFDPVTNVRNEIRDLAWSPDGTRFALLSDRRQAGSFQLFLNELDSGKTAAVHAELAPSAKIPSFEWSGNGRYLAWLANDRQEGRFELYRNDPTSSASSRLSGDMPGDSKGIRDFAWHPIAPVIAFRADARTTDHLELYQVGLDGTRIVRSSGSTDWNVGAWSWTRFFQR